MSDKNSVSLSEVINEYDLEKLYCPEKEILVKNLNVNRPGLPLAGFFEHFEPSRIQIIGKAEHLYLQRLDRKISDERIDGFFSKKPVAVVYSTSLEPNDGILEAAEKYEIPVLRTKYPTSQFMSQIIAFLHLKLAPCIIRHGVFVEVYGEGILIFGESGIGKSETAIELVKRGHRLIADDAVELRRVSDMTILGSAPELIRHYVELRGIGIVDVKRIFGMGAVKDTEKVDLIVRLEPWEQSRMYDRMGIQSQYTDIMGIDILTTTIPVHPGRNLAIIIEIAAMNNRQKKMGINTAVEFNEKMLRSTGMSDEEVRRETEAMMTKEHLK